MRTRFAEVSSDALDELLVPAVAAAERFPLDDVPEP
jgi:hypothetical protein